MQNVSESHKEQVKALNEILEKAYDAEKGYKEAADNVDSPNLKSTFLDYSQQRYDFGHEIKQELAKLNAEPEKGASFASGLHRVWMDIRALFTSDDEEAVLRECMRGESDALSHYESVLDKIPFGTATRDVVLRQYNAVKQAYQNMEQLAATYNHAS